MKKNKKNKIMLSRVIAPLIPSCKEYKAITGEKTPYCPSYWGELSKGHRHINRKKNGKKLSPEDIKTIREFWYTNSRIAPNNQFVVKKKTKTTDTVYTYLIYGQHSI